MAEGRQRAAWERNVAVTTLLCGLWNLWRGKNRPIKPELFDPYHAERKRLARERAPVINDVAELKAAFVGVKKKEKRT